MRPILFFLITLVSHLTHAGSYQVPAPAELVKESNWENVTSSAKIESGVLTIKYCLPTDLVGTHLPMIEASGKVSSDFIKVSGDDVVGVCMRSSQKPLTCMLRYPGMPIDDGSRDESLRSHFRGAQFDLRNKLARLFSADPAGLLTVDLDDPSQ